MRLRIFLPTRVLLDEDVTAVTAMGMNGSFGLRPRHIDCVSALVPGLLSYRRSHQPEESFVAVDRGILVKHADEVRVLVRHAVADAPLEELANLVEQHFAVLDEHERQVRTAVARLQADFLRRFMQL
jgi:F-type H+-transporting ATPase subunit epsilon